MADFVSLTCPSCNGKLQIGKDLEQFACGYWYQGISLGRKTAQEIQLAQQLDQKRNELVRHHQVVQS